MTQIKEYRIRKLKAEYRRRQRKNSFAGTYERGVEAGLLWAIECLGVEKKQTKRKN